MRFLKLVIFFLACASSGQLLAQQPWSYSDSSDSQMLAWNGGGYHRHHHHHFYGHRHGHGYRPYYYRQYPRVIFVPRYYNGYGMQPYYYPYYRNPRIVIQYYDPRRGVFIGSDVGGY
ncbi:hypothetical protein [Pseudomonas sp. LFM046]|uniref:hypothetical protein n=1 Tax=Pseudomonas sp. LFM046 TaxID=1608357 RepID=UPI0005CFD37D|nr:hypothetical protein [Pseudomonas sp. LFM046]